ncbi:hypothetical protein ACFQH6_17995 [Halobacteriaceae archaeon GCM10025711]
MRWTVPGRGAYVERPTRPLASSTGGSWMQEAGSEVARPGAMTTRLAVSFRLWQFSWVILSAFTAVFVVATVGFGVTGFELTFFVWFVGFLVGVELFAPRHVAPALWSRIRLVMIIGLVVTGLIVARHVLVSLP